MHQDKREMHTQNKRKQTNKQGKKEKKTEQNKIIALVNCFFLAKVTTTKSLQRK